MRIFAPIPGASDDDDSQDEGMVVSFDKNEEVNLFEQLVRQHREALRNRIATDEHLWDAGLGPAGERGRTYFQLGMVDAWIAELESMERNDGD